MTYTAAWRPCLILRCCAAALLAAIAACQQSPDHEFARSHECAAWQVDSSEASSDRPESWARDGGGDLMQARTLRCLAYVPSASIAQVFDN